MKKAIFSFLTVIISCTMLTAQTRKSIRVKAGEDLAQAYSKYGFYRFPSFGKATLYFRSGGHNQDMLFNYNVLSGSLQFIGPSGDTLEVAGIGAIDSVVFEKNKFYNTEGLMELVANAANIRLVKKVIIKMQAENIGAYGQPNPTSSIVNYNTYFSGINVYNLTVNQDIVIVETTHWYFLDKNNTLHKASKANLLLLLPDDKKSGIENYLRQNKSQFDKEQDLLRIMANI